jgi:GDP-mannose 6-dehydrogenase
VVGERRLRATTSCPEAIEHSELAMICVGTPGRPNGQLNVEAVARIGEEIGQALKSRTAPLTVVLRSTVLPGTTEQVLAPALRKGGAAALRVAVNPEFLREGTALRDFSRPPITLVGCEDPAVAAQLRALYAGIEAQFVETQIKTAEMMKYVSNSWHALKICFANEIGNICSAYSVDAHEVMRIFMMDRKLNIRPYGTAAGW